MVVRLTTPHWKMSKEIHIWERLIPTLAIISPVVLCLGIEPWNFRYIENSMILWDFIKHPWCYFSLLPLYWPSSLLFSWTPSPLFHFSLLIVHILFSYKAAPTYGLFIISWFLWFLHALCSIWEFGFRKCKWKRACFFISLDLGDFT